MNNQLIINDNLMDKILDRLTSQIFELFFFNPNLVILSLQPRGLLLGKALAERLSNKFHSNIVFGKIDPSFYRDDYGQGKKFIIPSGSDFEIDIEGLPVLLIDDVIYTGRTSRAAINSLQDFGRPKWIKILVLVNRHLERQLPIAVDYEGLKIDLRTHQNIRVKQNLLGKIELILSND